MEVLSERTCGTVELSAFCSAGGMARAISSLMVIFSRLQLDDFGSDESRACRNWGEMRKKKHRLNSQQVKKGTEKKKELDEYNQIIRFTPAFVPFVVYSETCYSTYYAPHEPQ